MSKDTCIKANTYCPVHKGIVGADCWHDSKDFSVPRTDWKQVDEINTLREQVKKLTEAYDQCGRTVQDYGRTIDQTESRLREVATHCANVEQELAAIAEQNAELQRMLNERS